MSLNGVSQSWNPAPFCAPLTGSWSVPCSQPAPSNDPNNFINDFVNSFTTTGAVTNINNMNSGCCGLPNSYIFYCNHPLVVTAGQTLTLSVQSASVWAGGFAIFIDWNQDNTFQLPSEKVGYTPSTVPGGAWASMTITVPPAQPNGVYRMRVREVWSTTGFGIHPCNMHGYGETEDYNIYIGVSPPLPPVVSATASPNQTVCIGQNANLSVSYSGTTSTNFDWTGPNSFTSSIQSPTVVNTTTVNNGFYHVTLGTSTCPVMAFTHVYVNPGPMISIASTNSIICSGATVALTAFSANNYTWTPSSSTNTSIIVSPTATTIYSVTGTATNNICPGYKTYTLTVNQGPMVNIITSNSVICTGGSATLSVNGANSYTWAPGSSTNTSIIVSPTATTIYTVTGTATNNACSTKNTVTLTVNSCVGINEWNLYNGVGFIYPSPFKDELVIKTKEPIHIKMINSLGVLVLEKYILSEETLDVSALPSGVYFIRVGDGKLKNPIKLIKD